MKYFFILFLVISSLLTAEEKKQEKIPLMLQITSDFKIPNDFKDGVEEGLTSLEYMLIDEQTQEEALKEQGIEGTTDEGCFDDSCFVNMGKMLAAHAIIIVEITPVSTNNYKFKAKYLDMMLNSTTKSTTLYYKNSFKDLSALKTFGKELAVNLIKNKVQHELTFKYFGISTGFNGYYYAFDKESFNDSQYTLGITSELKFLELNWWFLNINLIKATGFYGLNDWKGIGFNLLDVGFIYKGIRLGLKPLDYIALSNGKDTLITYSGINLAYNLKINAVDISFYLDGKLGVKGKKGEDLTGFVLSSGINIIYMK